MADGNVTINIDADDKQAQKRLNELNRSITKLGNNINSLNSQQLNISNDLRDAQQQAVACYNEIERLKQALAQSEQKTGPYGPQISLDEYQAELEKQAQIKAQLAEQNKLLPKLEANAQKLEDKHSKILSDIEQQKAALEQQKAAAGELEGKVSQNGGTAETQGKVAAATAKTNFSLKKGLTTILKWGFGIRSLFVLVRKLRQYIKEAINVFAENDPETKAAMTELKNNLATLKASWGAAFAPIVSAVIPILNTLVGWLTSAANAVASFFAILSGKSTFKKAVNNANALSGSLSDAAGSAASAKKELMGIDELNVMSDNSGGGGGAGSDISFVEENVGELGKFGQFFKDIIDMTKEWIALLDFEPLKKAWNTLKSAVGPYLEEIGKIILWIYDNIVLPFGKWLIEKFIPKAIELLAPLYRIFTKILQLLEQVLKPIWDNILKPLFEWIGDTVNLGLDGLLGGLNKIADWVEQFNLEEFINNVKSWWNELVDESLRSSEEHKQNMQAFYDEIAQKWEDIKQAFSDGVDSVKQFWNDLKLQAETAKQAGKDMISGLIDGFAEKWNEFKGSVELMWENFKLWWNGLSLNNISLKLPHIQVNWDAVDNVIARFFGVTALPRLSVSWYARGGIVDGATLIGAGEQGKEAIIPLERNTGWIKNIASQLAEYLLPAMPQVASGTMIPPNMSGYNDVLDKLENLIGRMDSGTVGTPIELTSKLYLDKRQIGEAVTSYQNDRARALGV